MALLQHCQIHRQVYSEFNFQWKRSQPYLQIFVEHLKKSENWDPTRFLQSVYYKLTIIGLARTILESEVFLNERRTRLRPIAAAIRSHGHKWKASGQSSPVAFFSGLRAATEWSQSSIRKIVEVPPWGAFSFPSKCKSEIFFPKKTFFPNFENAIFGTILARGS